MLSEPITDCADIADRGVPRRSPADRGLGPGARDGRRRAARWLMSRPVCPLRTGFRHSAGAAWRLFEAGLEQDPPGGNVVAGSGDLAGDGVPDRHERLCWCFRQGGSPIGGGGKVVECWAKAEVGPERPAHQRHVAGPRTRGSDCRHAPGRASPPRSYLTRHSARSDSRVYQQRPCQDSLFGRGWGLNSAASAADARSGLRRFTREEHHRRGPLRGGEAIGWGTGTV